MGSKFESLICINCSKKYPANTHSRCTICGGILTAKYRLGDRFEESSSPGIWRFKDLLPPVREQNVVTLHEGLTPYVEARGFAFSEGIKNVLCKLEGCNPTGSFKDRAASLGLSLAKEWGKSGVFTASSGNAAAAISAYAARAALRCLVLIREDSTASKVSQIAMYSPALLRVRGLFETQKSLEAALAITQKALPNWFNHFLWAPYNPLLVDAFKTISYELAFSGEPLPDYIFVPVAGGDLIYAIYKGFQELKVMGVIERLPHLVAVQGEGANPTIVAIERGLKSVPETGRAETIAGALKVSFGSEHALVAVYETGGFGVSVSDDEIIEAQRKIAKLDGIFCEVSSAAALAATSKALVTGRIRRADSVSVILTGSGFKDFRPVFDDATKVQLATDVGSIPESLRTVIV